MSDKQSLAVNPLRRVTLADSLLIELRGQILSGRLRAGQQMPAEISIGEAFGVGRTTVREALRGLVAAGFVERQGNRLVVRDPSSLGQDQLDYGALAARVSVRELYETRKLIEVHTAELAAEHATSKGLHMLERLLIRTEAPHDESFKGADAEFHDAIARQCGNRVLLAVYENSRNLFFRLPTYWRLFGHGAHAAESGPGEHRHIFEAIAARDSEAAGDAMFDHLDRLELDLIARLEPETRVARTTA
ncbi:MAG TPA: FadR/GntR family transcriptional regulator [Chloroflexota bacterium]|nr:FadR/GntR family transcriptional regulator [Chloroflexota bacterium]